jgi:hypothetical protein
VEQVLDLLLSHLLNHLLVLHLVLHLLHPWVYADHLVGLALLTEAVPEMGAR